MVIVALTLIYPLTLTSISNPIIMVFQFNEDTMDSDINVINLVRNCRNRWLDEYYNNPFLTPEARTNAKDKFMYYERCLNRIRYN